MSETRVFELDELIEILPHRAPFLFVDRVLRLDPFRQIVAERQLRPEEPFFAGHFPNRPIMPGVLVTEALAQTSGLLLGLSQRQTAGSPAFPPMFYLAAAQMKYTHPAVPGDILTLHAESQGDFGALHRFSVEATTGRHRVAGGTLTLARIGEAV